MSDPAAVEQALAWAECVASGEIDVRENPDTTGHALDTLAAAVRELRQESYLLRYERDRWCDDCRQAQADLAALKGRTCANCKHAPDGGMRRCDIRDVALLYKEDWQGEDFTCGAWAAREGA